MRHAPVIVIAAAAVSLAFAGSAAAQQRLTPELLWKLGRVGDPVVSPDGQYAVYGLRTYNIEANKGNTDLYIIPVVGGEPQRLTNLPGSESNARWRPDGERIGFLAAKNGTRQLFEIKPDGTGLRRVTEYEHGLANFEYSPTGKHISFTAGVKLDKTPNEIYRDLPKANARIEDGLMYRHWDSWHEYDYSHLFVAEYRDGKVGEPRDLMEGERFDTPLNPFGGAEQIAWNTDGSAIAYTSKKLSGADAARSTNSDIYAVDIESGRTRNLTEGMAGYDLEPAFSPDGGTMAWLSMERDGFESDRNRMFVLDLASGEKRELTVGFDQDAHGPLWNADSETIFFTSEHLGTVQLYEVDVASAEIRQITEGRHNYRGFDVARMPEGERLIAGRQSMSSPTEIFRVDVRTGEASPLTSVNAKVLDHVKMGQVKERWVPSVDGKEILTWVILPPDFDPEREYPVLLYAQGGPQSTVSQFFSYRWNFQLMAAAGYVVVAPNRRGVPSFGQEWKEQISGDWGGLAMEDVLSAIDDVSAEPWADETRMGAIGASFGGYTVYWLAGNHEGRFKTFISHAGLFNLESFYGATEEIFFPQFDLEGPYWNDTTPASYEMSPHKFAGNWDTPMLVIHGENDYRVPVTEGLQAFTVLQLKNIESRLLYFPEEGHWVLNPQNGLLWHREFFAWLGKFLKPATS